MNEVQFSATLAASKLGAAVQATIDGQMNMIGNDMIQETQNFTTAASLVNFGSITGAPSKLLIANLEPVTVCTISAIALASGGAGYTAGDTLYFTDGNGIYGSATATTVVDGVITAATLASAGKYDNSQPPSISNTPTGGTGTGAVITLTLATAPGASLVVADDSGVTHFPQTIPPQDVVLLSPPSATVYCKSTSGTVSGLIIAAEK